jgi:hypothetical protein
MTQAVNLDYIFTQLDLTEDAQANATAVIESFAEAQQAKMKEHRSQMRDSDTRPSREEMEALREAQQAAATIALTDQLNTVLSPDQTVEVVEYINAHAAKRGEGQNHR